MGLFSDVGRKFEETKQALTDSKQAEYVCVSCEKTVDENYEHCPRCGEESVEPLT
jgi:rRNA maturation endonuclease Nob1